MKPDPERKAPGPHGTGPRAGFKTAPETTTNHGGAQASFAPHHATEARAVEMAGTLLHGICEHGNRPEIAMSPQEMPNPALRELLGEILETDAVGHGWEDVMIDLVTRYPGERGDRLRGELAKACAAPFPPDGAACIAAREFVLAHHRARRRWQLGKQIAAAVEAGQPVGELAAELSELEAGGDHAAGTIRAKAYELAFNPDDIPPPDESCLVIGEFPIAARGNLTVIQGKSKVGKSAVIAALLAACQRGTYQAAGDTLCMAWQGEETGAIVHLDTEQSPSDWHALVSRSIARSGMHSVSPRLVSLPLVRFARSERLTILRETMAFEAARQGGIAVVIIDGIADLCLSPNDEGEALEIVSRVMGLAHEFNCAIVCVLHENPGSDQGKTRGHLGSELNRKAFANLRIDKDAETAVSTIYGTEMRKREIPRNQGFCFAWDTAAGMHTFKGRAAGLKAAQREEKATTESRVFFAEIFANLDAIGKNDPLPIATPAEASEVYRETIGNGNIIKPEAMKKRMQKAETLGILGKASRNEWRLIPSGTSGSHRENENSSRP